MKNFLEADSVFRILDASANRCREGLRVVEEFVRFHREDVHLSERLKKLRHDLQQTLIRLSSEKWLPSRDTASDVGTRISTASERERGSLEQVVQANCKRVQESLRVLEEYSKLIEPQSGAEFEQIRYRFYDVEKEIFAKSWALQRIETAQLYLLISGLDNGEQLKFIVQESLAGGVDVIQLRDKEREDRELLEIAHKIRKWTRAAGALFIMNDRPDLALLCEADGVHVGQTELSVSDCRKLLGSERLIGLSTHDLAQAEQAVAEGADYLGVGPVFNSHTKIFSQLSGLEFVRQASAAVSIPMFAIGGVELSNVSEVLQAGIPRIAVSGGIISAANPMEMARQLVEKLKKSEQNEAE